MSTQTTNLGLIKDDENEFYNVGRVNANLDLIDAGIGGSIPKSLATAQNDVLVASGVGAWVKKTLAEFKTLLGLGSAAYTNSTAYEAVDANIMRKNSDQTMNALLMAQNNTSYTTKQVRNVYLSTSDPSGGGNGDIWIKYTP